jgi:hypothetical protein
VTDVEVRFSANQDIGIVAVAVCEKLQSEDDRSIGRILNWYNAQSGFSRLNGFEDICNISH